MTSKKARPSGCCPPCDIQTQFADEFVRQTPGPVLVVGSLIYPGRLDWRARHPNGVGVDMLAGDGVGVVANLEYSPLPETFAHIECLSVLEHTERPWKVAENLQEMLVEGGSIFVSVPWVWKYHGYPNDLWRFSHMTLPVLFPSIRWETVRYGVNGRLQESERSPKTGPEGHLPKMELFGFGVKGEN